MHPALFPGDWIAAGFSASAVNGSLITISLPAGRKPTPGASVTDWLKVLVAEEPFSHAPFHLPRLGEPPTHPAARKPGPFGGIPARLGLAAARRHMAEPGPPARDWATSIMAVVTRVPDGVPVK
jgi:hypothetical protein